MVGSKTVNGGIVENKSNNKLNEPTYHPGQDLGNTMDVESDESDNSSDEGISLHDSPQAKKSVHNYASALLQIAQGIEMKFFKPPFGVFKDYKDKNMQEKMLKIGVEKFHLWTESLMIATSYSQLFLHYNILNDSVKWAKSSLNATCIYCRRKCDPDKMLLCDGCNCGKHLFCFKPKLTVRTFSFFYIRLQILI